MVYRPTSRAKNFLHRSCHRRGSRKEGTVLKRTSVHYTEKTATILGHVIRKEELGVMALTGRIDGKGVKKGQGQYI